MGLGYRVLRGLSVAGFVLGGIVFGSLTAAVSTADIALAQASSIVVEGNRRVEADTIRSYFRLAPGERLDAGKIDAAYKALYRTGLFQDVRINQAGGRLVVTVVENPVINRVAFEGNKKAKDEQISAEIQSKPRGTFSRPMVQSDVSRIVEIYQRSGRYDVRVEPKIIELPNNRVDLIFEIDEGAKTGVKKIVFVGNRAYSDGRLKDIIRTGETSLLSFLKSNDIYDPDRLEVDRDLLRRFYLKHGFADVRIVSAVGEYDTSRNGFVVTFTIDEGDRYRFGTIDVQSRISVIDANSVRNRVRSVSGDIYNAEAVEKTVEEVTIEIAKRGYPFAVVRPRGDRNYETKIISVTYTIEDGPRVYVERINVRGNTRTRDYVIRREIDFAEGDAYNRALIERAERRLKNLQYFKTVKITNEPGSSPDRVVVNVDVEEQSTGQFSVAGGYSTTDGFIGEISVQERNLLGRGHVARAAVTYGSRSRGLELGFVEPYLFGYRLALGLDAFHKETTSAQYVSYTTKTTGGAVRFGIPLAENLSSQVRYSGYRQEINLPDQLRNCNNINPDFITTFPTPAVFASGAFVNTTGGTQNDCYFDGEASLAVRKELAQGAVFVSTVGYNITFSSLDQIKNPTKGIFAELKQDFAGVGGDVNFIKTTGDFRYYHEVLPDIVSLTRLQAGHATGWGGKDLRMLDHFQGGPSLIRGFSPAGFGPRDLTVGTNQDALGGSMYWAATAELQTPLYFLPKDFGMRFAAFVDAGQLWDYRGPTAWLPPEPGATGETLVVGDSNKLRSSAGVGIVWDSPFGPLRFDIAYPITKESYDKTQIFRFGGGTRF